MSLDAKFKPIEDLYKGEDKVALPSDNLPIQPFDFDSSLNLAPLEGEPLSFKKEESPGFFKTLAFAAFQVNEFSQAARFIKRELQFSHPADDPIPDDFNPKDFKYAKDYPPNYWWFISQGQSPNDIKARQDYVMQKINEEEYYQRGPFLANLMGGLIGGVFSPSSLIPISAAVKYAGVSQSVIRNTLKAAPSVAAQAVVHEGFMQATEVGGNLEDLAINTLRDSVYGLALLGGGIGLGAALRGGKIYNTRKIVNTIHDGVDINPILNEQTGEIEGYRAMPAKGLSVSAAKVSEAQELADTAFHSGFLFGIPGIQKIAGNSIIGSPIVQGLSSRFSVIRSFTDTMASHSILTKSIMDGNAKPDSAEDILSAYMAGSANFRLQYYSHFYEENGIIGGFNFSNAARALKQKALKQQSLSEEEFNRKVIDAVITQDFSHSDNINAAAKLVTKHLGDVYQEFKSASGYDSDIIVPANAKGYIPQNMDHMSLVKRPDEFRELTADWYATQDAAIEEATRPLVAAREKLRELRELEMEGDLTDRSIPQEIRAQRRLIESIEDSIERQVLESEALYLALEDRNFLTRKEASQIKKLQAPYRKKIKEADALQAEIRKLELDNLSKRTKSLESSIKKKREKYNNLKREADDIKFELDQRALNGEINPKLFTRDQNIIHFRDPKDTFKLRKPFTSHQERINSAEAQRNLYLNSTTEQIQQAIFGSNAPSLFSNPLKKRVFLVPAKILNDSGFLSSDVPSMVHSYSKNLGRHIALRRTFKDFNMTDEGFGPAAISRILNEEKISLEREIDEIKDKRQKEKERVKLHRDFEKSIEFAKGMMNAFMGITNASTKTLRVTKAIRNYAASTKLGGVPISQLTDLAAVVLKQGMWPFIRSGLVPFIKSLNGYSGSESAELFRGNAAHAHLGIQHLIDGYSAKFYDSGANPDVSISTHLESALQKAGSLSGNLFGTNSIENATQRLTASIMQSQIMQDMFAFAEGRLSKNRETALLQYGLDPKEWSGRFIKSFKKAGGFKDELGAYQSKYWLWDDDEAISRMAMTLRRGVYDTIIQRGLFTSPFWANNPIMGMLAMFHGWSFAAFNRYTVPMMQRFDAEKMFGVILMLGLGALSDPLRSLAKGEEFSLDEDDTWFANAFNAVSNSGVLGHTTDILQMMNKMVDGELLPKMTQRYQGWNKFSLLGPAAGISEDYFSIARDALTGRYSASTAKRALRVTPLTGVLPLRFATNKWIDSLDIPESRRDASGYEWREQ